MRPFSVRSRLSRTALLAALLAPGLLPSVGRRAAADEGLSLDPAEVTARVDHDIKYLASDELGGRGVGTEGIEVAAASIRDEFKKYGLVSGVEDGSYYQPFPIDGLGAVVADKTAAVLTSPSGEERTLVLGTDFQPQLSGARGPVSGELVFAGYGIVAPDINYDDYAGIDVTGKIVVVIRREPQANDPDSIFDGTQTSRYALIRSKLAFAKEKGAIGIVLVNDAAGVTETGGDTLAAPDLFGSTPDSLPFVHVTRATLDAMLAASPLDGAEGAKHDSLASIEQAIDKDLKPIGGPIGGWKLDYRTEVDTVMTSNVIGVIEGEGPLADETVIIGAHYDHLGMGGYGSRTPDRTEIHNGADDNATGTAAVLELARRFGSSGKKPARRLVFIAFSGEERGLIGSTYYVENPTVPLDKVIAMINYDMIGWLRNDALTIYGVASGVGLADVVAKAGEGTGLDLKPVDSGFAGSDHLPFVNRQIPALFLHTGLNATYHTPDDDYETINVEGAVRVIDYSEKLIDAIASLEERPAFQAAAPRGQRRRMAYLGARIDFSEDVQGLAVAEVTEGSPAETAGLKPGDIVLAIDGKELKTREELIEVLQAGQADQEVEIRIRRDGEEQAVKATYGRPPRRGGQ